MSDDLIARLSAGERWDGDNAEVLRACGWSASAHENFWRSPDLTLGWMHMHPLDSVDEALRMVSSGKTVNLRIYADGSATCAITDEGYCEDGEQIFPTAAIALTIAILEASRG